MDIRINDDSTISYIESLKGTQRFLNTNIDVVKMVLKHHTENVDLIKDLSDQIELLNNRFNVLQNSLDVLGISPNFNEIDSDFLEQKNRFKKHFSP